jgi:hypothetical protein
MLKTQENQKMKFHEAKDKNKKKRKAGQS